MVCPSCYRDYISQCPVSLSIKAGLIADTIYLAQMQDKFQKLHQTFFTTDGGGIGTIDTSELTEGLFTPYSGSFEFKVFDEENDLQDLTINGTAYDCIEFEVRGGDFQKTYLGEFVEEAASS